ncbi:hypothetical protein ACA910_007516 [Epithemia clementina (nom. ined.)]
MQGDVAKTEKEMEKLQGELAEAGKALKEAKQSKDKAFELQLYKLKEVLSAAKDAANQTEEKSAELHEKLVSHEMKQQLQRSGLLNFLVSSSSSLSLLLLLLRLS